MAGMVPYSDYEKALRRAWPFGAIDDFFAPVLSVDASDAFPMDVEDAGDHYAVTAHLPGVSKDEVDVELNEGSEDKGKNYLQKETSEWQASRGVYLKDAANEGITAKLADGVLTVNVPKIAEQKTNATKVEIQ